MSPIAGTACWVGAGGRCRPARDRMGTLPRMQSIGILDQRIVLCSAFLDQELQAGGEGVGIAGSVNERDISRLPDLIGALAAVS